MIIEKCNDIYVFQIIQKILIQYDNICLFFVYVYKFVVFDMNLLLWVLGMVNEFGFIIIRIREIRSFLMVIGFVNLKILLFNRKIYCCKYILLIKMIYKSYI